MPLAPSAAAGWEPRDVIALAAIASSVVVAVLTLWITGRQQRRARTEDREDRRWHEAISLLGPVYGLLVNADPQALPIKGDLTEAPRRLEEQRRRWESEMRPGLLAIAVGSHQSSQRELADKLSAVIDAALMMLVCVRRGSAAAVVEDRRVPPAGGRSTP